MDTAKASQQSAQASVDTAQNVVDGTNVGAVQRAADEAQAKEDSTSQSVKDAQANVAQAKKDEASYTAERSADSEALETASNRLDTAKEEAKAAQTKADQTQEAAKAAQTELEAVTNEAKYQNHIVLSHAYADALKKYAQDYLASGKQAKLDLRAMNKDLLSKNKYVVNPYDDNVKAIDINNIPLEMRTKLTLFAVQLINEIREQMGTDKVVANTDAIDMARLVADGYKADNWSWDDEGHDVPAVTKAAAHYGLLATGQYYEDMNTWKKGPHVELTYSQLKQRIYQAIITFMLNGWEWEHASSISGYSDQAGTTRHLGVDFSSRDDAYSTHFILVPDQAPYYTSKSTFNLKATVTEETPEQKLAKKQAAYDDAKTAADSATEALTAAKTNLASAQSSYDSAKNKLDSLSAPELTVAEAEKQLAAAEKEYNSAVEANKVAQAALANLSADQATKLKVLNEAKEALAAAVANTAAKQKSLEVEQAKLAELQKDQASAEEAVKTAKAAVEDAQSKVDAAEAHLANLQNADANLEQAQKALDVSRADLAEKKANLEEALAKLDALKAVSEEATSKYQKLAKELDAIKAEQARLAKYQAAINAAKDAQSHNSNTSNAVATQVFYNTSAFASASAAPSNASASVVAVAKDEAGNTITTFSDGDVVVTDSHGKEVSRSHTAKADVLPDTGESGSNTIFAMAALGLFGLAGLGLKRRNK